MAIRIEGLHIKNVRLFTELNIKFNKKFNVLAGPSGCGKTSALACIAHCFCYGYFEYSRFQKDAELWVDLSKDSEAYRIGLGAGSFIANEYRLYPVNEWLAPPPPADGQQRTSINVCQLKEELQSCPLFTGTRRVISYQCLQGFLREKKRIDILDEYFSCSIPFLHGEWQSSPKQWLINRIFMLEQEWATQEKQNWERLIQYLPAMAPPDSHFSYIKTGHDLEPIFSVGGKECYFEELSEGFLSVLSLIIDIFSWIEGVMEGDSRLAVNAKGTVCIDDFAAHLDPDWQSMLRQSFIDLFPNLQFIVASHSPYLLASTGPQEIIIMPQSHAEPVYNLLPEERSFAGYSAEEVWRFIMDKQ